MIRKKFETIWMFNNAFIKTLCIDTSDQMKSIKGDTL